MFLLSKYPPARLTATQMVVGTSCVAVPMVLNGAIGAKLHIPFSVVVRSGFGYYFGYFCIISRAILAMFWLGIQGANGAQCITIMLAASMSHYSAVCFSTKQKLTMN
jgi:NCS1 family nucleobase:cation symporter-1